ncbi:MAG: hypothetical protein OXE55_07135 [Flavobacteriaceae bacterium]|nr:hypothetical protein [Flavobacteriaceae bacterium]
MERYHGSVRKEVLGAYLIWIFRGDYRNHKAMMMAVSSPTSVGESEQSPPPNNISELAWDSEISHDEL